MYASEIRIQGPSVYEFHLKNKKQIIEQIKGMMTSDAISNDLKSSKKMYDRIAKVEESYNKIESVVRTKFTEAVLVGEISDHPPMAIIWRIQNMLQTELEKQFSEEDRLKTPQEHI